MARESYRKHGNAFLWIIVLVMFIAFIRLASIEHGQIHAWDVRQNAQFHSFDTALELFDNEFTGYLPPDVNAPYPPSDANDPTGKPYCGAMKLAEAMMGQDMLGFHSKSVFRADGKGANGVAELYLLPGKKYYRGMNLAVRRGPFLPPENANCFTLGDIYGSGNTGPFDPNLRVLCDVFKRKYQGRRLKAGMPILYYKADTSKTAHDVNDPDNPDNIYDYRDNHALLALGVPGEPEKKHPMYANPALFYRMARSYKVPQTDKPVKAETFILISAGDDGLYGTPDDICNFEWKFRPLGE